MVPLGFHRLYAGCARCVRLFDMPKRNLRIVKRVRNVPVLGICEGCNAQFRGDPKMGNAQSAIQEQFNSHKCKLIDSSQNALRIVRESTEGK